MLLSARWDAPRRLPSPSPPSRARSSASKRSSIDSSPGELPLEQALAAFEEGVTLSRRCTAELEAAERRIELLVGVGPDGPTTEPFLPGSEGGEAGD